MKNPARILVVDDSVTTAAVLEALLGGLGYEAASVKSGRQALAFIEEKAPHLIISDMVMPGMDGQELLRAVREQGYDMPFIMLTAHASIDSAVRAIKNGAFDYLEKGCPEDQFAVIIERALQHGRLTRDSKFKEHVVRRHKFQSIITNAPPMISALAAAERVVASPWTTVAILGESGVGKEVLARAIHFSGDGLPANFVAVNCAAIPETLLESELFGHVKGAFTGAAGERDGKFALARGGTLLLDEIGDMPLALQAKLLRVCEERLYCKVGSNRQLPADFRIIAATHRDLAALVGQGRFREDLFHRLNVYPVVIPPLRERKDDIPLLAEHFVSIFRRKMGKPLRGISSKAMETLLAYSWPGNVRELRNCLERAAIFADEELIRPEHVVIHGVPNTSTGGSVRLNLTFKPEEFSLDAVVNKVLEDTLKECKGNKSLAAQRLKINHKMFNRRNIPDEDWR